MKNKILLVCVLILVSCSTSNTMYEKPKNLIPKDSMVALLTDMYIVSSAKNIKNKFLKRDENYMYYVYQKYSIDSTRFNQSNVYYTSKPEEYTDLLKIVKSNIDSLASFYMEKRKIKDSLAEKELIPFDKKLRKGSKNLSIEKRPEKRLEKTPQRKPYLIEK
ncbi:DUF4296 domain-containing protein [Tenacibaculum finnmarkense]|uniref:DUF4296 domain-containing protein n=1 Tax=Tenacibaculum finnmarkense TaxID=2781243 RepID=UPI00187B41C0|nr:DUF4296 domain-containing protein [Tenacibaculum finnmarkense]MBE7692038.1 DUF4296 domain-containing protein [Tenacibaculum finnmarkense genomovar finnmarkense]